MRDQWTGRLSDYLDGGMRHSEREALEAHLMECAPCAALLAELRQVRAAARELPGMPVPDGIWPNIERAIASPRPPAREPGGRVTPIVGPLRARSFSMPEVIAACLAVALVSGGLVYAVLSHRGPAGTAVVPRAASMPQRAPAGAAVAPEPSRGAAGDPTYASRPPETSTIPATNAATNVQAPVPGNPEFAAHEEAIAELRKALASRRDQLDPATIRTLETNLAIIDLAIDQAKRALVADSANTYVKEHLADTMRRKVELLQRATMLASAGPEVSR